MFKEENIKKKIESVSSEIGFSIKSIFIEEKTLRVRLNIHEKSSDSIKGYFCKMFEGVIFNQIERVVYSSKKDTILLFGYLVSEFCDDNRALVKVKKNTKRKNCKLVIFQDELDEITNRVNNDDSIVNKKSQIIKEAFLLHDIDITSIVKKFIKPRTHKVQKFKELERLTLEEFLDIINTLYEEGKRVSDRKRHWEHLIRNNKLVCPVTNKKVHHCRYDLNEKGGSYHYNFYSEEGELFSIDHKVPISKGGSRSKIDNIQPMLSKSNTEKSNQMLYT